MRVLHLFSNHKWTGPAEPALNLAAELRHLGVQTEFACSPIGARRSTYVAGHARDRSFDPILEFALPKTRGLNLNVPDILRLQRYLRSHPFDLIHCHLPNDHNIAAHASRGRVPIVRSSYCGDGMRRLPFRTAYCLMRTTHLIEPSQRALDFDCRWYRFPKERATVVPGAIDTKRFDPERVPDDARDSLDIPKDAFVFGIVARMQRHRLFDVLLKAFREVAQEFSDAYLVIVGRGTHQEKVAKRPVAKMGLEDRVRFPGYVSDDDYVRLLNTFDMKVFMVPGTDGTCRAVREAMAMGKPALVNRVGMLPELVDDRTTGFVFNGTREALAETMRTALTDRDTVRAMGEAARRVAHTRFCIRKQAERVHEIYRQVLAPEP